MSNFPSRSKVELNKNLVEACFIVDVFMCFTSVFWPNGPTNAVWLLTNVSSTVVNVSSSAASTVVVPSTVPQTSRVHPGCAHISLPSHSQNPARETLPDEVGKFDFMNGVDMKEVFQTPCRTLVNVPRFLSKSWIVVFSFCLNEILDHRVEASKSLEADSVHDYSNSWKFFLAP